MEEFRHFHMPAELAMKFIVVFSRIEHALKSTGFVLGNESKVEAAWDRFANEVHEKFNQIDDEGVVNAKRFLLDYPPRKQVLVGKKVEFQDQMVDASQRETQQVIRFIRTVRNNLFHGGKYLPCGEVEAGRNQALVQNSLIVLLASLELNQEVKKSYEH